MSAHGHAVNNQHNKLISKFPDKTLCLSFVLISNLDFSCTTMFTYIPETCGPV